MRNRSSNILRAAAVGIAAATFAVVAVSSPAGQTPRPGSVPARTQQGTVQGITVGEVEEFRGVPYARPPVGDLRWRAPLPPHPYVNGTRDAAVYPAPCVQRNAPEGLPAPDEDCLYLNIYRPAGTEAGARTPVLVYIHGGGFSGGTASARDGSPLATAHDLIVVTINYRLGPLGWLALAALDAESDDGRTSGNYGLLDMLAALRWMQENIAAFGGDPGNVTISGTSAGGIGVCALMTAPLPEPLFHRAIIQSGECTDTSGFIVSHREALLQGALLAAAAGCADSAAFVTCLRALPAATIQSSAAGLGTFGANIGGHLMPRAPLDVIASDDMRRIPVIVGATHDEQRRSPLATTGFPATRESYDRYLAEAFGGLAPLVAAEYPPDAFEDPAYAAGAAASDSGIPNGIGVCPMLVELGGALARVTDTFAYELNDPEASVVTDFPGFQAGSLHTAEIGFLFAAIEPGARSLAQVELAGRMQRYWASFARDGRPGTATIEWPAVGATSGGVLRLRPSGDVLVPWESVSDEHRCRFWAQLGY